MARIFTNIDSFTTGEMSPKLRGRTDLQQYGNGLRLLENFTIAPQGGVDRRTGTRFISEIKNSANSARLVPFEFSTTQAYIIEMGPQYMRFYRNQGQILDSTDIVNGTFDSDVSSWTDNSVGTGSIAHNAGNSSMDIAAGAGTDFGKAEQVVSLGTGSYVLTLDVVSQTLTYNIGTSSGAGDIATGTVTAGLAETISFSPSAAGDVYISLENRNASTTLEVDNISLNSPVYEIETPYLEAELFQIQYAQSADVVYIVHANHAVHKLSRTGNDAWALTEVDLVDGPYLDENDTATTLALSGTTGSVTVTASTDTFVSTDVGRLVRFHDGTSWTWLEITAYSSATSVTATIKGEDAAATTATVRWRLGAFSETTGHPEAISFHEQRLYFANTDNQPQTLWGSRAGSIENFSPDNDTAQDEVDADTAVSFTTPSANVIHWLASKEALFLGTPGSIFIAQASTQNEAITPNNFSIKPAVGTGSRQTLPVVMQNATIFSQFFGDKLMELGYVFEDDSFGAADLTILSNKIISSPIKEFSRQEIPHDILWVVSDNGDLRALTYLRKEKVVGWHRHSLGGSSVAVDSVATIPGTTQSDVYFLVKRTIDGATKRYVEVMTAEFEGVKEDAWFVDSGLEFEATNTDTITGITQANPAVVTTSGSHGLSNGDFVELSGISGMSELNERTFEIKNVTATTFELKNLDSSGFTAYSSGGVVTELATTISGLDHLEGETVSLIADGATHPDKTVSSGAITLDRPVKNAIIGLGYTSTLETNIIDVATQTGTVQGSIGRIYKAIIRLYDSLGGKFGYDETKLDTILFRDGSDNMDSSPGLFTGDKVVDFPRGQNVGQKILVKQDQPLPMSILSIVLKMEISTV